MNMKMTKKWIRKEDLLSFLLPLVTMLIIFIGKGIFPFGQESFLRTDLYHQYAPFLREFQAKLQSFSSLHYSFNIGLGVNFTSLLAYYLASPLNFFVILFPKGLVVEYISYLIIIKIALSGMTASIYLRKHFQKNGLFSVLFSMIYALSGFVAAYSWNVMWLDCIFLFPLILLGLEELMDEGKGTLYTVSLALAILSNYYISIMICLFLILYFLSRLFYAKISDVRELGKQIGHFALYSLLAGIMAGILLLPAVFALRMTASASISFPKTFTQYFTIIDMMARLFPFVETEQGLKHWPNIYAGTLSLFILPLYFKNPAIQKKKKVIYAAFMLFFFLSFSINALNFIWHGFHYPNSLPARQSFIFVFLLIIQGAEWFLKRKTSSKKDLSFALFLSFSFVILCQKLITEEAFHWSVFYLTLLFLFLFYLLFYFEKRGLEVRIAELLLIALCFVELSINMAVTSVPTTSRAAYLEGGKETSKLLKELKIEDPGFYRLLREDAKTKDDGALMQYHSASIFSSTAYGDMSDWYTELGMEASTNAYSINGASPLMKSLLGIKYEILKKEPKHSEVRGLSYLLGEGEYRLYENQFSLPLGYLLTKEELDAFDLHAGTPALVQNSISTALATDKIFTTILGKMEASSYHFTVEKAGDIYVYVNNEKVKEVKAILPGDEKSFDHVDRGYFLSLGYLNAGTELELKSLTSGENMDATAYSFSYEVLGQITDMLSSRGMEVENWKDGYVKGRINAGSDGLLFTSIPYDPGWKVKVDGNTVVTEKAFSAFLGIPVSAGEHDIELHFVPEGYYFGILFSISALLFFALLLFMKKRWDSEEIYYIRPERREKRIEEKRIEEKRIEERRMEEKRIEERRMEKAKIESKKIPEERRKEIETEANGRSRKRGSELAPYRGSLPKGRSRSQVVEKMDVKE